MAVVPGSLSASDVTPSYPFSPELHRISPMVHESSHVQMQPTTMSHAWNALFWYADGPCLCDLLPFHAAQRAQKTS